LIEAKGNGIFSLLDEESKLPKTSGAHFTSEVHSRLGGHFRLALPRASKLRLIWILYSSLDFYNKKWSYMEFSVVNKQ
jgi:hypothetical protein